MASIQPARSKAGAAGKAWSLIIEHPAGTDGKRRQRWVTFAGTRREAEREAARLQREADAGTLPDAGTITVREFLGDWLENSAALELAPQSLDAYRIAINAWSDALGGVKLAKLTPMLIQATVKQAQDAGRAPATIRLHHAVLHRALERAVDWGMLARNPADKITMPRARKQAVAQVLSAEQAVALLGAARDDWYGILAVLAVGLGVRAGEAGALKWSDVDWNAGTVCIQRSLQRDRTIKEPKGGRGRLVAMPEFVRLALLDTRRRQAEQAAGWNPDGWVCPSPLGKLIRVNTGTLMGRICAKAGVPKVRFHDLRHTHGTLLIAGGADIKDVSERLGHSSVQITLAIYHHVLPHTRHDTATRLDGMLKGPAKPGGEQSG